MAKTEGFVQMLQLCPHQIVGPKGKVNIGNTADKNTGDSTQGDLSDAGGEDDKIGEQNNSGAVVPARELTTGGHSVVFSKHGNTPYNQQLYVGESVTIRADRILVKDMIIANGPKPKKTWFIGNELIEEEEGGDNY